MMPLYGFVFADYSARGLFRAPQLFFLLAEFMSSPIFFGLQKSEIFQVCAKNLRRKVLYACNLICIPIKVSFSQLYHCHL